MKKILILLGPPGAGKGTVGAHLARQWGIPLISSGDLLRESVRNSTELGQQARQFMVRGQLVPDRLVLGLIGQRLARTDAAGGFILDGFPRTAAQAEALSQLLDEENFRVIYLKASDDFLVERLSNRRVCELCGAIFHLINIPPRQPGVCDSCGGRLIQRDDDQPEVIRNRLAVYHEQTTPLLNYYRQAGRLTEVSGERPLQETLETIQQQCPW